MPDGTVEQISRFDGQTSNGTGVGSNLLLLPINSDQDSFTLSATVNDQNANRTWAWKIVGAEQVIPSGYDGNSALLEENGYQILPSGMIMQWGKVSHTAAGNTVIFPIPFPNDCFNVTGELIGNDVQANLGITGISKTGFSMNPLIGSTSYWHAIGW